MTKMQFCLTKDSHLNFAGPECGFASSQREYLTGKFSTVRSIYIVDDQSGLGGRIPAYTESTVESIFY